MKLPDRRQFLHLTAGAAALPALPRVARAEAYPARTVTIIVPVAPGGTTDVAARIIGEYMARLLGQQFIVENMPGAGGTTGSTRAMRVTYALLLNSVLGVKPTMVPFTGGAPAASALVGGQIDYMVNGINEVGQQVQAGTIKAYAMTAAERHPALPNVPTTLEAGLPEFLALPWFALFAPKGVHQPILDKIYDALTLALDDDNVRRRLVDIGGNVPGKAKRGQQPLAALVKSEIARWTPIIKAANIKGE